MKFARPVLVGLGLSLTQGLAVAGDSSRQAVEFDLPPQSLSTALSAFAQQSDLRVVFYTDVAEGMRSPEVRGTLTPEGALKILLAPANLVYEFSDSTVTIWSAKEFAARRDGNIRLAGGTARSADSVPGSQPTEPRDSAERSTASRPPTPESADAGTASTPTTRGIPEVLVKGSRSLNSDIERTEDDTQPYVVYDRTAIERSGATSIDDFLRNRLTMNAAALSNGDIGGPLGSVSSINLRGLGTNQTLILIDGRRVAGTQLDGSPGQPDINGVPLAAIERVEVLPATSSGIYGGGATGGVINIVLRRDYSGVGVKLSYGNSFRSDAGASTIDLSGGHSFNDGRTKVTFSGSYSETDAFENLDRTFIERGREHILANNPNGILQFDIFPPLGSTPNVRSVNGSPLFGPNTPSFTYVPSGYVGVGGLAAFLQNAGQWNLERADSAQPTAAHQSLVPETTSQSFMISVRQAITPRIDAFMDASASRKRDSYMASTLTSSTFTVARTAPNNPFGQDVYVTIPTAVLDHTRDSDVDNLRVSAGTLVRLAGEWSAAADYTWTRFKGTFRVGNPGLTGAYQTLIRNGQIDVLRDLSSAPIDLSPYLQPRAITTPHRTSSQDIVLRLAGPMFSAPGGPATLSTLVERQRDFFGDGSTTTMFGTFIRPSKRQATNSIYLESILPLFGHENSKPGLSELSLQAAVRYDDYSMNGAVTSISATQPITRQNSSFHSTNPTFGIKYRPIDQVMIRASYGTGFVPPSVVQLVKNAPSVRTVTDPRRANEVVSTTVLLGGNADLKPEDSKSLSYGVVLTPLPELRMSVDYVRIRKTDNITAYPGSSQAIVNDESLLPGRVRRDTVAPGDPFGVGRITVIDATLFNIARADVDAFDFQIDYTQPTDRFGTFSLYALGTRQTHYRTQTTPTAAVVESVSVNYLNPLKFKANAGVSWSRGSWTLGWDARYFDDYLVGVANIHVTPSQILSQGDDGYVPSQIYHDAFATYRLTNGFSILENAEVQLLVRNVFDKEPPFDAAISSRLVSVLGDPRLATYALTLKTSF